MNGAGAPPAGERHGGDLPRVSVVVPVLNEERYIESCLAQLLAQDYPAGRLEILVVDCCSDDGTREIVSRVRRLGAPRGGGAAAGDAGERPAIRPLEDPKRQRASALNVGIRAALGDVIVRVDARTMVPRDYVRRCVATLLATGADNVGGIQQPVAATPMQEAIGVAMSHPFGVGNAQFRIGKKSGPVDTVYLGSFRRDVFDRVGLFDDSIPVLSEDSDMNQRIRESGGVVYLDTAIHAYYHPRETLGGLWRLYFHYGGARAGNLLKHGRLTASRQWVPPAGILLLGGLGGLAAINRAFLPWVLAVVIGYLLCDVGVSGYLGYTLGKWSLWPRLLAVFPAMHMAWGLGFLNRLLWRQGKGAASDAGNPLRRRWGVRPPRRGR